MTPFAPRTEILRNPILLWAAFIIVHLWLGALNLYGPGLPFGDVTIVYKFWTDQAIVANYWVGIDGSWVYPIVALVPMLVSRVFGPTLFPNTWLSLVLVLDIVAFGVLTGWGRNRRTTVVAWWWVGFLLLLGPIALGRIDSITVPLAIIGVLLVATRPRAAAVILTIATWIKVWPAALLAAILISVRARMQVVLGALVTSLVIVAVALSLGAGANLFSFVTEQSVRGLQVEAPISNIWLWERFAGSTSTFVYYDQALLTWQVRGPGAQVASVLMNPLMMLVVAAITVLAILAVRNRVPAHDLLAPLSLAYVVAIIAFNKVGSPQYVTWLAVPVILGLTTNQLGCGRPFRTPAIMVLVVAGLTQLIYPYFYGDVLRLNPVMLTVLSARNLLYFVLLGWAIVTLWRASRQREATIPLEAGHDEGWLPAVWPFRAERPGPDDRDRLGEDELAR